ncbi:MAG: hypothetical protein V4717_24530 [Bacteroidota bacterium]
MTRDCTDKHELFYGAHETIAKTAMCLPGLPATGHRQDEGEATNPSHPPGECKQVVGEATAQSLAQHQQRQQFG